MTFFPPGRLHLLPSSPALAQDRARMLAQAADGVILGPQVYTFGRLEHRLARELAPEAETLSDLGRDMILDGLIRQAPPGGNHPAQNPGFTWERRPGLTQKAAEAIEALRLAGVSSAQYLEFLDQRPLDDRGLGRLFALYEAALAVRNRTDPAGLRRLILDRLTAGVAPPCLAGIQTIVIHGFNRFTPFQTDLIKALALTRRVETRLACPEWALTAEGRAADHPFLETLETIGVLEGAGEGTRLDLSVDTEPVADRPPALAFLATHLFRPEIPSPPPPPGPELRLLSAAGRYLEIEAVGRRIHALLDQGAPPDSIAVVVRDLGPFGEMIEDVFRRFGLPLAFRRGAPLRIQGPVRSALALLDLASSHWDRDRVLDLLASPYLDLGFPVPWSEVAQLTGQMGVTDERAGGGWAENLGRLARTQPHQARTAALVLEGLQRLREKIGTLSRPQIWPAFLDRIRGLLLDFKMEDRIKAEAFPFLHRDALALAGFRDCLDDLDRAARQAGLADAVLDPRSLSWGLGRALEARNIGVGRVMAPGVWVLNAFDLHGLTLDHVFVMGLNENVFPQTDPENLFVGDALAFDLGRHFRRRVFPTRDADWRGQALLFYHAAVSARQSLTLSYTRTDEKGRIQLASVLLDEVRRLWPEGWLEEIRLEYQSAPGWPDVLTRQELLARLALEAQSGQGTRLGGRVRAGILARPEERDAWLSLEYRRERERALMNGEAGGRVSAAHRAFWWAALDRYDGRPLVSPLFLEDYGRCPFAFWGRRVMNLEPVDEVGDEIRPMDEGTLVHRVLHSFLKDETKIGVWPPGEDPLVWERLTSALDRVLGEAGQTMAVGRRPLWRVRREKMRRMLRHWLRVENGREEPLVPSRFEWLFGPPETKSPADAAALAVPFLSGPGLYVRGRVDRIDLGPGLAWAIDYKTGRNAAQHRNRMKPDALGVRGFQAPLYQLAAARTFDRPVQAAWMVLGDFEKPKPLLSVSTQDPLFETDPEVRKEAGEANFFNRLEALWGRLESGGFAPRPAPGECLYCAFRFACRVVRPDGGEDEENGEA